MSADIFPNIDIPVVGVERVLFVRVMYSLLGRTPPAPEPTDEDDGAAEPPPPAGSPAARSAAALAPAAGPHLTGGAPGATGDTDTSFTEGRPWRGRCGATSGPRPRCRGG